MESSSNETRHDVSILWVTRTFEELEGLIGIFLLGLIIYLIIRHPLKSLSLAFKLLIIFILGIAGFLGLFGAMLSL